MRSRLAAMIIILRHQLRRIFGRCSLYISADVKAGDTLTPDNVKSVRPGFGLHPKYYEKVIGRRFARDRSLGDRLTIGDISDFSIDPEDIKNMTNAVVVGGGISGIVAAVLLNKKFEHVSIIEASPTCTWWSP